MCMGCGNLNIDMMRTLKSFYFWVFLIVVFFSFLCCHTNLYAGRRKRRSGVLYGRRCKFCHDSMSSANIRPEPVSQRTIPSNNSIPSLPPASNHIAEQLLNQRPNVETPPPAFETVVSFNPSPLSTTRRSAENSPSHKATIDPPPPYPGPPPGESSL